ncbi:hypothetical protein SESBI_38952 [Sesbania bispinosa]|nr:hypothetical protein SESBI_38952 [Sesbania bispinosa]
MSFTLVVHHRGAFVSDPYMRYKWGDVTAFYNMGIDNWSYFEALSIVKKLGYVGGVKLWWRIGKCEGKYEYKSITWDSHALEMANYAIDHNCEVNLVVEHVSVAVPNLIEALPEPELVKETQVVMGGNCDGHQVKGVNREDKVKRKGTLAMMMDLVKIKCIIFPLRKIHTLREPNTLREHHTLREPHILWQLHPMRELHRMRQLNIMRGLHKDPGVYG